MLNRIEARLERLENNVGSPRVVVVIGDDAPPAPDPGVTIVRVRFVSSRDRDDSTAH